MQRLEVGEDERPGVLPGSPESRVDSAVPTLRPRRLSSPRLSSRGSPVRGVVGVGDILLRHGTQIDNRIRNAIRPPKGDEDSPGYISMKTLLGVVENDVTTAVAHQRACIEGRDQFIGREVGATRSALEGRLDAGRAHAVGDIDDTREFLEFEEEGECDIGEGGRGEEVF